MCSQSTSNVRFITFVNTSSIEADDLELVFDILQKAEIVVLAFSWLEFLYIFYLLIFVRAMHFNLTILFANYGGQYFLSMVSRGFIIYQQLYPHSQDIQKIIFYANYTRTVCLFIAMYILPIFMIERCLATFFVRNYEKTRKVWVSLTILSIFHPLVLASAIAYIECWIPVVFHVVSFFIVNILGYIGIEMCYVRNTRRYKQFSQGTARYALSERFQLAENIKMCNVLKKVQFSILFFNIGCSSILIMDSFQLDLRIIYSFYTIFNLFTLVYGITIPIIVHSVLPEWKKETRRLFHTYLCCCLKANVQEIPKTTFGEKMIYKENEEANIYFNQFNHSTLGSVAGI